MTHKPIAPPFIVTRTNGHTIICEKESLRHVFTMEQWPDKELTAELIVKAVNNHELLITALQNLMEVVAEKGNYHRIGCVVATPCPYCAAERLIKSLKGE